MGNPHADERREILQARADATAHGIRAVLRRSPFRAPGIKCSPPIPTVERPAREDDRWLLELVRELKARDDAAKPRETHDGFSCCTIDIGPQGVTSCERLGPEDVCDRVLEGLDEGLVEAALAELGCRAESNGDLHVNPGGRELPRLAQLGALYGGVGADATTSVVVLDIGPPLRRDAPVVRRQRHRGRARGHRSSAPPKRRGRTGEDPRTPQDEQDDESDEPAPTPGRSRRAWALFFLVVAVAVSAFGLFRPEDTRPQDDLIAADEAFDIAIYRSDCAIKDAEVPKAGVWSSEGWIEPSGSYGDDEEGYGHYLADCYDDETREEAQAIVGLLERGDAYEAADKLWELGQRASEGSEGVIPSSFYGAVREAAEAQLEIEEAEQCIEEAQPQPVRKMARPVLRDEPGLLIPPRRPRARSARRSRPTPARSSNDPPGPSDGAPSDDDDPDLAHARTEGPPCPERDRCAQIANAPGGAS